jgi:CRISPR-associated endonuclease/helicase Cas3
MSEAPTSLSSQALNGYLSLFESVHNGGSNGLLFGTALFGERLSPVGADDWVVESEFVVDQSLWGKFDTHASKYPLICHLLDTSASAQVLWDRWLRPGLRTLIAQVIADGDEDEARAIVAAVAGLHDLGKANKVFQGQLFNRRRDAAFTAVTAQLSSDGYETSIPAGVIGGLPLPEVYQAILRRHEAVGLFALAEHWPSGAESVAQTWAAAVIGGHHGRYHPKFDSKPADPASASRHLSAQIAGKWGAQQRAHHDAVLAGNGVTKEQLDRVLSAESSGAVVILLTGLVMLSDWLASDLESVNAGVECRVDPTLDPMAWVQQRNGHFTGSIGATLGLYEDPVDPLSAIMGAHVSSLSPLQEAARSIGRGLWIATETTGSGKTEAAMLRHAAVAGEGVLFALPTRATTDAMFERIGGFYASAPNAASLLHAHRTLNAFYSSEANEAGLHSTSWLADTRNALFAPVAVGTCDQVLLGSLKQKNTPVRLLALANRHIVIDEVHTFDHYQSALLEELLAWWGKTDTRVTLLSASLPTAVIERYVSAYGGSDNVGAYHYPGHTTVTRGDVSSTLLKSQRSYALRIRVHEVAAESLIDTHVARAIAYREQYPDARIAIVVNQVDRAIAIGKLLVATGCRTIVLHSRMAAGHRTAISRELNEVAGKGSTERGVFVVGTQLIESSLDLDFDLMITDLAPAPALIQRAGRLWRSTAVTAEKWGPHKFERPGVGPLLDVISPMNADGALHDWASLPYLPGELTRTLAALKHTGELVKIPSDVQGLVDSAAFDPFDPNNALEKPDVAKELIAAGRKLMAAESVVVPFHHKHGDDCVLGNETTYRALSQLTERDELSETSTRLVEQPTAECFLVDESSTSQWVWRGTVETALFSRDKNVCRAVLRLTFPLAESRLRQSSSLEAIPGFPLDDEKRRRGPLQRNLVPVRLLPGANYDDLLGLLLPLRTRMRTADLITPAQSTSAEGSLLAIN